MIVGVGETRQTGIAITKVVAHTTTIVMTLVGEAAATAMTTATDAPTADTTRTAVATARSAVPQGKPLKVTSRSE